jgi:four helix bundle protein
MTTTKRFEELDCWQAARSFVSVVYRLTKSNGFKKDFELVSQIRRSAVSSMANTAEGFHRSSSKDFMKFLDYSRSSIAETISHAYVAMDQNYISEKEMNELKLSGNCVWKKINGLISYLNRNQRTNKTNRTNQTNKTNSTNLTNKQRN